MNSVELGERIIELKKKKGMTVIFTSQLCSEACGNLHGFIKSWNSQQWVGRQHVFLMLLSGKMRHNRSKYVSVKDKAQTHRAWFSDHQATSRYPSQDVLSPARQLWGRHFSQSDTDPSFENVLQDLGPKDPLGVM